MKRLLITGFEPFGGETVNPSWEAVRRLPETSGGLEVRTLRIPTAYGRAGERVLAAAAELAPILEMDRAELGGLLMGEGEKSTFVYIKKDISPETWRKVNALAIPGIEPEQYMKRVYPNGRVAGNILGFVGLSGDGDLPRPLRHGPDRFHTAPPIK